MFQKYKFLLVFVVFYTYAQNDDFNYLGLKSVNYEGVDVAMKPRKLHDVKSPYTLVFFYDYGCHHCREIIPMISAKYDSLKKQGIEFYGICTTHHADTLILKHAIERWGLKGLQVYPKDFNAMFDGTPGNFRPATLPTFFLLDRKKVFLTGAITDPKRLFEILSGLPKP